MKLPVADPQKLIKLVVSLGFRPIGQSGSHVQFKSEKGTIVTIPLHPGRGVGRGLVRKILRDLEMDREEFIRRLKRL